MKTIHSPKGLANFDRPEWSDRKSKSVTADEVRGVLSHYRKDCEDLLAEHGFTKPWRSYLRLNNDKQVGVAFWAAKVLQRVTRLEGWLAVGRPADEVLLSALLLATDVHGLAKAVYEAERFAGRGAIKGGKERRKTRQTATRQRDYEMAVVFKNKRKYSHLSDTALMVNIGAANIPPLSPRAAARAIKRGLKII